MGDVFAASPFPLIMLLAQSDKSLPGTLSPEAFLTIVLPGGS